MAMREYEDCVFCDETPFTGRRFAYNRESERYEIRLFEARLQVNPEKIFADLSTPNGIQMLWSHGAGSAAGNSGWFGFGAAIGRVLSMEFNRKRLIGRVAMSEADLQQFVPGGLDAVEAGINRGLSIGICFLDNPPISWVMGEGTREDPDRMMYEAVRIQELSLTPVPRLYTAGLGRRIGGDPAASQESENAAA